MNSLVNLNLNIYNYNVKIISSSKKLHTRLRNDFEYFIENNKKGEIVCLEVEIIFVEEIPLHRIPSTPSFTRKNVTTYDNAHIRTSNYENNALTIFDYKNETCVIYSNNLDLGHELTYLIVLSRVGKYMDLRGLHRVHAMGIQSTKFNILMMMHSGGGKTTLFMDMLKEEDMKFFSDDTPIINPKGEVLPYPLRIGFSSKPDLGNLRDDCYILKRREYGEKYLVPISKIKKSVAENNARETIVFIGKRKGINEPVIEKASCLIALLSLFKNLILGIGTPIILEYFIEFRLSEFWNYLKIAVSRTQAALMLYRNSKVYIFNLSDSRQLNVQMLKNFLHPCPGGKLNG